MSSNSRPSLGWRRRVALFALAAGSGLFASPAATAESPATGTRPVLLELFTSQGCSSCPPADAVLRDLAARPDVLALGFHVDYWDYLGWADAFASPQFTSRQHDYARARRFQVYTPQLVIDGRTAVVGSRRAQAEAAIDAAAQAPAVPATLVRNGSRLRIEIGTLPGQTAAGEVWLCSYDPVREAYIRAGENAGRRIVYPNVVRSWRRLGDWDNAPLTLDEPLRDDERGERLALIVQARDGQVWAVAQGK